MRARFARPDDPENVVATATWTGGDVEVEAADESVRLALGRVFRRTAVVEDDPALRTAGSSGPVELPPGSLMWFLAAARTRGKAEGYKVSFTPSDGGGIGWDPAGTYRPFLHQVERLHLPAGTSG